MGNYYAGDLLYSDLITSRGLDPNAPTNSTEAYKVLLKLEEVIEKRFSGASRDQIRRELEMARLGLKLYESNNNTRAKLAETRGRDARAVTAALTSRRNSIEKNRAYVQSRLNANPDMRKVDAAYATGGVNDAVRALVNLRDDRGATIDSNHPAVHGYMDRFVRTVTKGKQGIEDIDPATFTSTLAGLDSTLATQLEPLLVGGKQSINSLKSAQVELSNNLAKVSEGLGIAGSANVPQATLDKLVQDEILRNDEDAALVERLLGRSAADYEIEKQVLVENDAEYQRLLALEEEMKARLTGGSPGTGDKIGRIVATPVFQQWALSNGFRLGNSKIVDGKVEYFPGADDVKAIVAFQWQMKHPGKFSPFGFGNSTGATVRVTVDNPERKEQIIREYAYNGKLYVDENGDLVKPSTMSEQAASRGLVPSVQVAVVDDTVIFRKPDGSFVGMDGAPVDAALASRGDFSDATLVNENGAPTRYLTVSDLKPENEGKIGFTDPTTPDGAAEIAAFDKTLSSASPFREVSPDTVRAQTAITAVGKLDKLHAADLTSPEGFGGVSLDNGKTRFNASDRATIEVLEAPTKSLLAQVRRAFRGNLTEAEALKMAAAEPMTVSERLTAADRAAEARRAEAEGRTVTGEMGDEVGAGDTITVSRTDTFGNVELAEVPADSQAARVAAAAGQVVSRPAAPAAPTAAPAAPATEPTERRRVAGSGGYEYAELSDGSFRITKGPKPESVGKIVKPGDSTHAAIKSEVDKAPAAAAPKPAAVPTRGAAEGVRLPEPEPKPEIGRRAGTAVVSYGQKAPEPEAPGAAAPQTGPAAPQRGEAGAARRRPIRDLIERLRGRGPDEGMRAAEKAFSEEEKKAAERTKERERYGAIGEMPTARTDVLPEAREPGGAKTAATREQEGAAAAAMSPGAAPLAQDAEAIMRGRDESLMGLVSTRKAPTGYAGNVPLGQDYDPRYGDLAYQYKNLQGGKRINPELYASEVRKLADEARRRMATPRDVQLKTSSAFPGDVLGQGSNIENETPVVRLPSSETELATSPFLARIIEGRQARTAAPAEAASLATPDRAETSEAVPAQEVDRASLKEMTDKTAADIAKLPGAPPKVTPFTSSTRTPEERAAGATKKMKTFTQLQEEARRERMGGM